MPSQQSHTHTFPAKIMHTCTRAGTHMLVFLRMSLRTHLLYEAEDFPTTGNHNLTYTGLVQIHIGPFFFYNVYTMI